jgi:hypothetical protein
MPVKPVVGRPLARLALAAGVWAGSLSLPAWGQEAKPPATQKPAAAAPAAPAERPMRLPEVKLEQVGFADVINFLRDVDPTFQAVVSYAPGVERGEPVIQELQLKNVTTASVLQLLAEAYPQVSLDETGVDAGGSQIWMIRVGPDPRVPEPTQDDGPPPPVTTVHRLREIVDGLSADKADAAARKKALDGVMSVVQAALETQQAAVGGERTQRRADAVRLSLHEATETLVFKGPHDAAELVGETLTTLLPTKREVDARNVNELDALRRENERLRAEVDALRKRLEESMRRTGTGEPPAQPPQPNAR